jgi:hypothetical protein
MGLPRLAVIQSGPPMIRFVPIDVECYAGYKGEETPRGFTWNGRRYEVEEILDRWYQGSRDPIVAASDYFKVRIADGIQCIVRRDRQSSAWYLMEAEAE